MNEWYAVIAVGVLVLGSAITIILVLISRAASRREQAKNPLDPDSAEGLRVARNQGAASRDQADKGYGRSGA